MTDKDYAAHICCRIFHVEHADDMHAHGVLDAIHTLTEREQRALEYYYRDGLTYAQIGVDMGLSQSQARRIIVKALLKLRHPARSGNMRVSNML